MVLLTVTRSPSKAGMRALRSADAMQPPVGVPANGGPLMFALVTRPDGAKVMTTLATPEGSPSFLQPEAAVAAVVSAAAAAARSNGPAGSPLSTGGGGAGAGSFGSSFGAVAAGSGLVSAGALAGCCAAAGGAVASL